jgi:hypothetical protein
MKSFVFVSLLILSGSLSAQSLVNGGFEGTPQDATVPAGWFACAEGTTPDILPGFWGVYTEASEGETFMGIITRTDGSYESIGQRLSAPLKQKECYKMTLDLAHSRTYSGYNNPLRIRIWGGTGRCGKDQLLYESELIDHTDWETYSFTFTALANYHYIIIEAFHQEGRHSYRGNILIDHIRPLKICERA